MKRWFSAIWMVVLAGGLAAAACSSQNGTGSPSGIASNNDAGDGAALAEADGGDAGEDAVVPTQAYLRIAHVSPDMPAIDICVALHGTTTFQGPLLAQLAVSLGGSEDAAGPGLSYAQVSAYVPLDPGHYDVRIVGAGASSCAASLSSSRSLGVGDDGGEGDAGILDGADGDTSGEAGALDAAPSEDASRDAGAAGDANVMLDASGPTGATDTTNLSSLAVGTFATLLVAGEVSPAGGDQGLSVTILADDGVLASGAAVLRAINAMPQLPLVDVGLGAAASGWLPLFTDVAFGAAGAKTGSGDGTPDPNGYLPIAPVSAQAMSARASGLDAAVDIAVASSVEIDMGSIATVIAIGGKTGDSANLPSLLLCIDNQPSGGLLSDCSVAR